MRKTLVFHFPHDRGGTVLGLHLVSEMAAMLHGTIRATSVLGEERTMTCLLPAALVVQNMHGIQNARTAAKGTQTWTGSGSINL